MRCGKKINIHIAHTPRGCAPSVLLRQIAIRIHLRAFDSLEILALDERFDTLLDHVDLGLELACELTQRLGDELLMREFLALPADWLATIH
jgi:ribosome assembly protein YihI (activator of Der GTPase)